VFGKDMSCRNMVTQLKTEYARFLQERMAHRDAEHAARGAMKAPLSLSTDHKTVGHQILPLLFFFFF
jgi:hypothetical protein